MTERIKDPGATGVYMTWVYDHTVNTFEHELLAWSSERKTWAEVRATGNEIRLKELLASDSTVIRWWELSCPDDISIREYIKEIALNMDALVIADELIQTKMRADGSEDRGGWIPALSENDRRKDKEDIDASVWIEPAILAGEISELYEYDACDDLTAPLTYEILDRIQEFSDIIAAGEGEDLAALLMERADQAKAMTQVRAGFAFGVLRLHAWIHKEISDHDACIFHRYRENDLKVMNELLDSMKDEDEFVFRMNHVIEEYRAQIRKDMM